MPALAANAPADVPVNTPSDAPAGAPETTPTDAITTADALNRRGSALVDAGHLAEAEVLFRDLVVRYPDSASGHINLGVTRARRGDNEGAVAALAAAIAVNPFDSLAHYHLGNLRLREGNTRGALYWFDRALDLDPDRADAHNNRGVVLLAMGRLDDAASAFREATFRVADDPDYWFNLGSAEAHRGQLDASIAAYDRVLKLRPDYVGGRNNQGANYYRIGRYDAATSLFAAAAAAEPDNPVPQRNLCATMRVRGTHAGARTACDGARARGALRAGPDAPTAQVLLPSAMGPGAGAGMTAPLVEAFVEFRVSKTRGSGFHRVLVDGQERPYLDVAESLAEWLDMAADCQYDRGYCQAVLQPVGRLYWIDAENRQLGDADSGARPLPRGALIRQEGRLWLRYDLWSEWLPMTTTWSLWSYTLGFRPQFSLLGDLKRQRENSRRLEALRVAAAQWRAQIPATLPPDAPRMEGRYRVQGGRPSARANAALDVDVDLAADVFRGTAELAANRHVEENNNAGRLDFWRYRNLSHPRVHLLEVGDTRMNAGTLLSAVNLRNGVRIERLKRTKGAGTFELRDRAQPGTEVDVFRNGFLEDTFVTGPDGFYEIPERFVSGGDQITLRLYFPDGSQRTRTIRIARDNAMILEPGQWDANLAVGDAEDGGFAHGSARYGLWDDFSAGLHGYRLPRRLGNAENGAAIDLAWRPSPGLTLLAEGLHTGVGVDWEVSADVTGIPLNTFQLEARRLGPGSAATQMVGQVDTDRRLTRLRHIFRLARWGWQAEFTATDQQRRLETNTDYNLTRRLALRGETEHAFNDGIPGQRRVQAGVVYNFTRAIRLELDRARVSTGNRWSGNVRLQGGRYLGWDADLSMTQQAGEQVDTNARVTWRVSRRLWLSASWGVSGWGGQLTWSDVVAPSPGPRYWDEFGTGTLSGRIMTPAAPGQASQPLSDVQVRADAVRTVTDVDGRFVLTGLPTNARVQIRLDPNTLDATLRPATEAQVVRFRPGTHIQGALPLTWTLGLDGLLQGPGLISTGAMVEAIHLRDGRVMATTEVEGDGFFLLEGLVPGGYQLRVTGVETPPMPLDVELPEGEDWVSGVTWPWPSPSLEGISR